MLLSGKFPRLIGLLCIIAAVLLSLPDSGFCYYFGKNKIQYEKRSWREFETDNLVIYFYSGGARLAEFAADAGDNAVEEYCRDFNHILSSKIPVIIFNSHNEFEQTNVISQMVPEEVGGFTEYFKQRVVVPFEGNYQEFHHVIRHELVHAVMFDMLFGRTFSRIVSAQVQLNVPLWFVEGLAEYESSRWDTRADMILRDAVITGYLPEIEYLDMMPYQGGQSLFKYIADKYGHNKIGEILNKIRYARDVEEGFKIALGRDFEKLGREWHLAMKKRYWPELSHRVEPAGFARQLTDHVEWRNYFNTSPAVSPDGSSVAFLSDRNAYTDILLYNITEDKLGPRLVKGERTSSFEEMHWLRSGITWSPDEEQIAFAAKMGGKDALYIIDAATGKVQEKFVFALEGVFSPSWSPDGKYIAFSGIHAGRSDIYYIEIAEKNPVPINVTDDLFSDEDPAWDSDGRSIFFVSDRGGRFDVAGSAGDSLHQHDVSHFDLYRIWLGDKPEIDRITTDFAREREPFCAPGLPVLVFISDKGGVSNIYSLPLDRSTGPVPLTNVLTGCFNPSITSDGALLVFSSYHFGGWDLFSIDNPLNAAWQNGSFEDSGYEAASAAEVPPNSIHNQSLLVSDKGQEHISETENYQEFDPDEGSVDTPGRMRAVIIGDSAEERSAGGKAEEAGKYRIKFSPDLVYGSAGYDPYFGFLGYSQIALSDQLGNHRIFFLFDMFSDFESSNVMARYYYLPGRNDYSIGAFHNAYYSITDDTDLVPGAGTDLLFIKDRIFGVSGSVSRPLTKFDRIDFALSISGIEREYMDYWTLEHKARERRNILYPSLFFVHDTVLWGMTGPMDGARSFLGVESSPGWGDKDNRIEFLTFLGDIRKYWMINKEYSFAFRMFGGYSTGRSPTSFYLGGMDNWLNYRLGPGAYPNGIEEIYFSSFVTPLRGAKYYEQTGTRALLGNLSFRFPLIKHLKMGWPLPIELYNVRGSLFLDIGAAWNSGDGFDPLDLTSDGMPKLDDAKAGCGIGLRMNLGIFVFLVDMAWPTDLAGFPEPPVTYVSIGSEF